jgi:hypothetical protein
MVAEGGSVNPDRHAASTQTVGSDQFEQFHFE